MSNAKPQVRMVRQGDIFYARIPETEGSVQHGVRPVIITQNNRLNRNSTTYVCVLVTSQIKRLDLPEHVLLPKTAGLPRASMAMAEQRMTIDRTQLIEYVGKVRKETYKRIRRALRVCEKVEKHYKR
ncbi:MAG: type II toxin-antitoxin system PemK/MazF family toxin [Firmicutes bacterium]|nr:type II toxin-antitoxin system PemK/MazF family toxin [Bacillota bacterium]